MQLLLDELLSTQYNKLQNTFIDMVYVAINADSSLDQKALREMSVVQKRSKGRRIPCYLVVEIGRILWNGW